MHRRPCQGCAGASVCVHIHTRACSCHLSQSFLEGMLPDSLSCTCSCVCMRTRTRTHTRAASMAEAPRPHQSGSLPLSMRVEWPAGSGEGGLICLQSAFTLFLECGRGTLAPTLCFSATSYHSLPTTRQPPPPDSVQPWEQPHATKAAQAGESGRSGSPEPGLCHQHRALGGSLRPSHPQLVPAPGLGLSICNRIRIASPDLSQVVLRIR